MNKAILMRLGFYKSSENEYQLDFPKSGITLIWNLENECGSGFENGDEIFDSNDLNVFFEYLGKYIELEK